MRINYLKCKVMTPDNNRNIIDGHYVEQVRDFKFLGRKSKTVQQMFSIASLVAQASGRLRDKSWNSSYVSRQLKRRLYKALILTIAIYGSKVCTLRKADTRTLLIFEMKCFKVHSGSHKTAKVEKCRCAQHIQYCEND